MMVKDLGNLCLLLLMLITIVSCESNPHPVVKQFDEMQKHQQNLKFAELEPYLDERSTEFVNALFKAKNIDDYLDLGQKYKTHYFLAEYYRWNHNIPQFAKFEHLVSFLNQKQFSYFDLKYNFTPLENKAKYYEDDYYLPLGYSFHETNKIRWIRFNSNGENEFKYDLIYTLQQEEDNYKEKYAHNLKSKPNPKSPEAYRILYEVLPKAERKLDQEKLTLEKFNKSRDQ